MYGVGVLNFSSGNLRIKAVSVILEFELEMKI